MNRKFITQIELIINKNLYKRKIIDEETFLKVEDHLLIKLKKL